ncbi:YqaE/Pmp3 family membrane protein [Ascidiimonas sp. W6]|uniref:YqaE/Pmp3 family membrane protein n=1 Tax=Ascidiimonas meishanensis TaxID=3128903 RepID=UPI0030EB64AC
MPLLTIILSLLVPPLAVFLKHGLGGAFLINLLLTILGWLPGVIHAFYVNR